MENHSSETIKFNGDALFLMKQKEWIDERRKKLKWGWRRKKRREKKIILNNKNWSGKGKELSVTWFWMFLNRWMIFENLYHLKILDPMRHLWDGNITIIRKSMQFFSLLLSFRATKRYACTWEETEFKGFFILRFSKKCSIDQISNENETKQ